jgi:hypothetical protein
MVDRRSPGFVVGVDVFFNAVIVDSQHESFRTLFSKPCNVSS